jgi:hypothetical protein
MPRFLEIRSLLLLALFSSSACDRTKSPSSAGPDAPSMTTSTSSTASPSASVAETPLPAQKGECPMEIYPGRGLGPVRIGQRREELESLGLPVKEVSPQHGTTEFVEVGPIHVELCGGVVVEAWLDDLRKAPECIRYAGKTVDRTQTRDQFISLFSDCKETPPRIGGTFKACNQGGVRIGWGMGDFIQVRVARTGSRMDESCEMILDDGGGVPLPADTTAKLLQKTLDIDLLAKFWHSDLKGRDPLRIAKSNALKDTPALTMFGAPVVWIDRAEAEKKKLPYFEFTKIESSATKTRIEFRYPVEGVVGNVVFLKRFDDWTLDEKNVAER